jgi:nicotinate dehydrogenase subunit A
MTGAELLARNKHPTDEEIRDAFAELICRCGTHNAAVKAVQTRCRKGV